MAIEVPPGTRPDAVHACARCGTAERLFGGAAAGWCAPCHAALVAAGSPSSSHPLLMTFEAWNRRDLDAMRAFCTPEYAAARTDPRETSASWLGRRLQRSRNRRVAQRNPESQLVPEVVLVEPTDPSVVWTRTRVTFPNADGTSRTAAIRVIKGRSERGLLAEQWTYPPLPVARA